MSINDTNHNSSLLVSSIGYSICTDTASLNKYSIEDKTKSDVHVTVTTMNCKSTNQSKLLTAVTSVNTSLGKRTRYKDSQIATPTPTNTIQSPKGVSMKLNGGVNAKSVIDRVENIEPNNDVKYLFPSYSKTKEVNQLGIDFNSTKSTDQVSNPMSITIDQKGHNKSLIEDNYVNLTPTPADLIIKKSRLTIISLELHCNTRPNLLPNPQYDSIQFIAWTVRDTRGNADTEETRLIYGIISVVQSNKSIIKSSNHDLKYPMNAQMTLNQQTQILKSCHLKPQTVCELVLNEHDLFISLIKLFETLDPDIIVGYELQKESLGFIIQRGQYIGIINDLIAF